MSGIALVLPTRGRPELLHRFVYSFVGNAKDPNSIKFYFYVDDDDINTIKYCTETSEFRNKFIIVVGPRIKMSETANRLVPYVTEDIFFCGGDDLIMRTPSWDTIVRDFFDKSEDKIWLAYGYDGFHTDFATHPILHRKWVETLGFLTPPYFESDYADTWLDEIATRLHRKHQLPMFNEHMHFTFGKAPMDQTYYDNRIRYSKTSPQNVYHELLEKRLEDTEKLRCKII